MEREAGSEDGTPVRKSAQVAVVIAILVMVVVYRLGALAINRYVSQPYIIESPATVITGPLPTDTP